MDVTSGTCWNVVVLLVAMICTSCSNRETSSRSLQVASITVAKKNDAAPLGVDWSEWRGGSAHAVSIAKDVPVHWGRNRSIKWRRDVPGRGNSSPVVYGDHVFLTTQLDNAGDEQLVVICVDRRNGKTIWQRKLGNFHGRTHEKNGYASATPAISDHGIFCHFGAAGLYCLDKMGKVRWHLSTQWLDQKWGTASSPVLFGNAVIQLCDGEGPSYLLALEQDNGTEIWRTPRSSHGCWTTPVIMQVTQETGSHFELIVNGTGSRNGAAGLVTSYDPYSGEELWRVRGTTDIPCPTAIVGDEMVVSSSGANGPIFAIHPGGEGDVSLTHVAWRRTSGGPDVASGVIEAGKLYVVSGRGIATCYRVADGQELWRARLAGDFSASLVAGGGHVYATSEQGDIYVMAMADEFVLVSKNRLYERCLATPAIVDREIYLRTEHRLYCIETTIVAARNDDEALADSQSAPGVIP